MTANITLTGSPEDLDKITRRPIYLDVFGNVRFVKDSDYTGVKWWDNE